ncbi:unnamed protein product [Heligmosomoides polygyrus]|uniref:EloA-BP1 domain-containing protein n=1 Tax=Heligmosomoides polygyrus TaxID=6339 RepID=A0A183GI11_HELPZ|nr:unnamed protein product [Heligmosomoides polygyrus]
MATDDQTWLAQLLRENRDTQELLHYLYGSETGATPKLRDPTNSKIPYSIRVSFLSKIFSQYLESELEEKAIVDKVRHVQGYKVAAINLIGRIRNAKSTGSGKSRAGLTSCNRQNTTLDEEGVLRTFFCVLY